MKDKINLYHILNCVNLRAKNHEIANSYTETFPVYYQELYKRLCKLRGLNTEKDSSDSIEDNLHKGYKIGIDRVVSHENIDIELNYNNYKYLSVEYIIEKSDGSKIIRYFNFDTLKKILPNDEVEKYANFYLTNVEVDLEFFNKHFKEDIIPYLAKANTKYLDLNLIAKKYPTELNSFIYSTNQLSKEFIAEYHHLLDFKHIILLADFDENIHYNLIKDYTSLTFDEVLDSYNMIYRF